MPGGDNGLRNRLATMAAHGLILTIDAGGQIQISRHGQTTMKTMIYV